MRELKDAMRRMRGQYHAQPVPDELYRRLEQVTSSPAKQRRPLLLWFRRAGTGAAAALVALCVTANSSASAAAALGDLPVLGGLIRTFTFRQYRSSENGVELEISTPHISGLGDPKAEAAINEQFDLYADKIIAQYEADVASMAGLENARESISSDYRVMIDNDRQLTISIYTTIVMASAQEFTTFYNIDKQTGELVSLRALFAEDADYITPISEEIIRQMRQRMESDPNVYYWVDDEVEAWNFTAIAEDQAYYVNEDGQLVISFDKYAVAPGYMGSSEFVIPSDVISGITAPDSLLCR